MSGSGSRDAGRFCAAAFTADWTFYLIFTAVPLRAIRMGCGPIILGLLPALHAAVYILAALNFGRISDRGGRMRMARLGAITMTIGALLLWRATTIGEMFLYLILVSVGGGLFWPTIQAELGDRGEPSALARRMGWFNVAWSSGKMFGFLTAGHIAQVYGPRMPLLIAVGMGLLVLVLTPGERAGERRAAPPGEPEAAPPEVRRRYRIAAWAANLVAFGVGATLNYQFPKQLFSLGLKEGNLGDFLGLAGLAQTLTFAWLGWRRGWEYRRAALLVPLSVGLASVAALGFARGEGMILACAPGIGVALGFAYSASLFHSLHREAASGRNTGIHEALLRVGGLLLPLAGGALARFTALSAPCFLCAGAFAAALAIVALRIRPEWAGREAAS